jgi:hypothetical protein
VFFAPGIDKGATFTDLVAGPSGTVWFGSTDAAGSSYVGSYSADGTVVAVFQRHLRVAAAGAQKRPVV